MPEKKDGPIRPTDDEARALARGLLDGARFAALAVMEPGTAMPMVSRVAMGTTPKGAPLTLISTLSGHTTALTANPACSLLVGEPGEKGDPLTHPRLTLQCSAEFLTGAAAQNAEMRQHYLQAHPKAKLYIDFADFRFVAFRVLRGYLNGGFGKAFHLTPADLGL